jgi:hypothetical protein
MIKKTCLNEVNNFLLSKRWPPASTHETLDGNAHIPSVFIHGVSG